MSEQEKIALTCMALFATYGEDNPRTQAYQEQFKDDPEMVTKLIEVNVFYRQLVESRILG